MAFLIYLHFLTHLLDSHLASPTFLTLVWLFVAHRQIVVRVRGFAEDLPKLMGWVEFK